MLLLASLVCEERLHLNHDCWRGRATPAKTHRSQVWFWHLTSEKSARLDPKQISRLTAEVAALIQRGHQCITVTSGAVAAGMSALSLKERPLDLATAQASAAVGQSKLMRAYETAFARYKLNVAQLLLTHSDLDSRTRRANAKNTIERLLAPVMWSQSLTRTIL